MGEMNVMTKEGDTELKWDPDVGMEVRAARAAFNAYMEKGYVAYEPARFGGKGQRVTEFDPALDKLILVPPIQGG